MPREIKLLRVVVVSPSDVRPERDALQSILESVNRDSAHERGFHLDLSRWETDAYPGFHPEGPQGLIDDLLNLDDADIVIGIFWTRFGTTIANGQTGTEHELTAAIEVWRKNERPQVMVYFNCASYSPKDSTETDQWSRVLKFKEDFPKEGLWWHYDGKDNFSKLVEGHLRKLITTLGAPWKPPNPPGGHSSKPKLKYALGVLGILVITTAIYTFHPKKTPLILIGSSNVHSYLKAKITPSVWNDIGPIWFDLASGDTQRTAYAAFANGASNRQDLGFIALSSGGTKTLAEEFAKDAKDKDKGNKWFLSIVVARQPLAVFYRLNDSSSHNVLKNLKVRDADYLPNELGGGKASRPYHFVNLINLRGIIDKPNLEKEQNVALYLTTGNSATKSLFQQAAKDENWKIGDWSQPTTVRLKIE